MITLREYIKNALSKLNSANSLNEKWRLSGAIECALCMAGFIVPSQKFEYRAVKRGLLDWFRLPNHETYPELIQRLATEYLKQTEENDNQN